MRRVLVPIISIILVLLLSSLLNFGPNTSTVKAQSYFSDNFNDGNANGWTQQLDSWTVKNGEYCVSAGTVENGISTVNGLNLTDCVIETQLRFTDATGYEGGIVFRYSDNSHYYAFQIGHEYNHMEIITYDAANPDYGNYAKRAVIQPLLGNNSIPINLNVNYTLRIEIQGTNFNAYFNGQHVLSWTDNSYSSGLVGLRARNAQVSFDNFNVFAITQPTPTPSPTASPFPTPSTHPTPSSSPTPVPTVSPSPIPTASPSPTPSPSLTSTTSPSPTPMPTTFSDEFTSGTLDSRWSVIDPAGASTFSLSSNPGYLTISTSIPPDRDLWNGVNFNSPRILQPVYGNFSIETKVLGNFNANIQSAGIVVWKDQNNYLRLERDYRNNYQEIIFNGMINGKYSTTAPETVNPGSLIHIQDINATYLKITRSQNTFSGYYSSDGSNWTFLSNITLNIDYSVNAGLYNVLRFAPSFSVSFDYFRVTSIDLQTKPVLDISCKSSTSYSGFNVEIRGSLAFKGTGISDAPVLLSYSVNGGKSWEDLTLVNTGSDGSFSAAWMPSVTGNYLVRATYEGDANYSGTTTIVNMAVTQFAEQNVFSVTSNSTVSNLAFNSTSKELSFSVTGPSGTSGYADVYIAKTLIQDASSIYIYLDGNKIDHTVISTGDSWLLHFIYSHSTHEITVGLSSSAGLNGYLGNWIIYVLIAITVILVVAVMILRRKKSNQKRI